MFFPVYILIQISFTELWEVLCNKDINQLMDEAEHDIRIMLVEKCFILRKPHPITVFLFIQSISNYKTSLPWSRKFQSSWRYCLILVSFGLWLGSRLWNLCKGMFTLKYILQITVQSSVEWYFCFSCYVFGGYSSAITREILRNVLQLCGQNKWDRVFRFFFSDNYP